MSEQHLIALPGQIALGSVSFRHWVANSFDVLSVDVFDTALTRTVETPVDVFAKLERHVSGTLGNKAEGLAVSRERAEELARSRARNSGHEEVTFHEIYCQLGELRPDLQPHIHAIQEWEIKTEQSVLLAVPEVRNLIAAIRSVGRRVVFVSDMYLPQTVVADLLKACGHDSSEGLLVSASTGRTKASGGQWAMLRALAGAEARILHIGDDAWSDVASPERHGITGWLFRGARSDRRPGGPLKPAILPFSRAARLAWPAGQRRADTLPTDRNTGAEREASFAFMRRFGESWGLVVVGSFLRWLEMKVRQHDLTHLVFCARDGWLTYRGWHAMGCDRRTDINAEYLYVSRRALNLAEGGLDHAQGRLSATALDRIAAGEMPLGTMLDRSGLLACDGLVAAALREFGSMETMVWRPEGNARFRDLLIRHQAEVLTALQPLRIAAEGYLRRAFPRSGRVGVVDIGWHGTLQASLARLLPEGSDRPQLSGFYYGLWPRAQRMRPRAGWMEGCFGNDFRQLEEQAGLHFAVALLENLHLAPHGSTMGYRRAGEEWMPVLQDSPIEAAQHATLIAPFQDAALDALQQLATKGKVAGIDLDALDPAAGLAAIERVALSPTPEERAVLGSIEHAVDFDHSRFRPLVPKPSRSVAPPWPMATDWPMATAIAWQEAARDADEAGWREDVLARMRSIRDRLDARSSKVIA